MSTSDPDADIMDLCVLFLLIDHSNAQRRRHNLLRSALLPPQFSSWNHLLNFGDNVSFLDVTSFLRPAFMVLKTALLVHYVPPLRMCLPLSLSPSLPPRLLPPRSPRSCLHAPAQDPRRERCVSVRYRNIVVKCMLSLPVPSLELGVFLLPPPAASCQLSATQQPREGG
jgi:hypothetical protein